MTSSLKQSFEKCLQYISKNQNPWNSHKNLQEQNQVDKNLFYQALKMCPPEHQDRITQEFLGYGPLESLVSDPDVDEILLIGAHHIAFERHGVLYNSDSYFLNEISFQRFMEKCTSSFLKSLSYENPTGNGLWEQFRVHAIGPPLSESPQISLRRIGGLKIQSLHRLKELETLNAQSQALLEKLIAHKKNILISGATGSGKTTLIQCLINTIKKERLVLIEDSQELIPPNPLSSSLKCPAREEQYTQSFPMKDLVKEALRMRPDRLVLGEVRSEEAKDYIQALNTGHRGCIASIHANSPQDALMRLECLILSGAHNWSPHITKQFIFNAIDYVIQVKKSPDNSKRYVSSICRLSSIESLHILLDEEISPS